MFRDVTTGMINYRHSAVMRAAALLPAAGAYDSANIILINTLNYLFITLYCKYTRSPGTAGSVRFQFSFRLPELSSSAVYRQTALKQGTVTPGSDVLSNIQGNAVEYKPTADGAELFIVGPWYIGGDTVNARLIAREVGAVATPGNFQVIARLS